MKKLTFVVALIVLATIGPPFDSDDSASRVVLAQGQGGNQDPWAPATFNNFKLRSVGPALMSGRISVIAVHPEDKQTWYIGIASGGVWKTTNAGTTFTPVFQNEGAYSIGSVAIDAKNPSVV